MHGAIGVLRTQTSKMEHIAKIVNGFQLLMIFTKSFVLEIDGVLITPLRALHNIFQGNAYGREKSCT